jgi:hypothetical protein
MCVISCVEVFVECPACGEVSVWVPGLQFGLRRCTCPCHRGVVDEEG